MYSDYIDIKYIIFENVFICEKNISDIKMCIIF